MARWRRGGADVRLLAVRSDTSRWWRPGGDARLAAPSSCSSSGRLSSIPASTRQHAASSMTSTSPGQTDQLGYATSRPESSRLRVLAGRDAVRLGLLRRASPADSTTAQPPARLARPRVHSARPRNGWGEARRRRPSSGRMLTLHQKLIPPARTIRFTSPTTSAPRTGAALSAC